MTAFDGINLPTDGTRDAPATTPNARHLSSSVEHYTPPSVVERARTVLGGIDLDPASCAEANETVQAARYIALPRDGLAIAETWKGRVFLNPPGGSFKRKSKADPIDPVKEAHRKHWRTESSAVAWWRKLVQAHEAARVPAAIFVGFTLEILQSTQDPELAVGSPLDFAICVPSDRLRFDGDAPTHANVIVYLGPKRELFRRTFADLGAVKL